MADHTFDGVFTQANPRLPAAEPDAERFGELDAPVERPGVAPI